MKRLYFHIVCFLALIAILLVFSGTAFAAGDRVLILTDEQQSPSVIPSSSSVLENLLGHFDLSYDVKTIDEYAQGDIDNHRVTFYIGSVWDRDLPASFLDDVLSTDQRVVWINYNLWKLAWGPYQQAFEDRYHIRYIQTAETSGFDQIQFEGWSFDWLSDVFAEIQVLNNQNVTDLATVSDGAETCPYILQSGNLFFVADDPMMNFNESSQYLVFCELMHSMVGITHGEEHRALVRIEDVDPLEDPARIMAIADYLFNEGVPFSLAVIPRFEDPLGAWGPPVSMSLADNPELINALKYAQARGGTIIMHGYTHQYDSMPNPYNGVTSLDSEFYITQMDGNGNINLISPVPEDSESWVQNRIDSGLAIFDNVGLSRPDIWETPHYLASELDRGVFASNFEVSYERFTDAFFPYLINRSVYNAAVIPENLGYIEPGYIEPQQIIARAESNLAIRDGFASFFFHSEEDINDLIATVEGIEAAGYSFVSVDSLIPQAPVCTGEKPLLNLNLGNVYWASMSDYQEGALSADYMIYNDGPYAANVTVVDSTNSNGVMWLPDVPLPVDLAAGTSTSFTLRYQVPPDVVNFKSVTYVTASDACGNQFYYPAPSPSV